MNSYDDDENVYRYNENRRNHPLIRAEVEEYLRNQAEAVKEAQKLVEQAYEVCAKRTVT